MAPASAVQTAGHALLLQDHGVVLWEPKVCLQCGCLSAELRSAAFPAQAAPLWDCQ